MTDCLKAAIITAVASTLMGIVSLGAAVYCSYMNYKLAMATLQATLQKQETQDGH